MGQKVSTITGVVLDSELKEPIPGVAIRIKGNAQTSFTNVDGKFSVQAKQGDIIVLSHVSYQYLERKIEAATTMQITLFQNASKLNEVVVVGYGEVNRTDLTGSVGQVKIDDLMKAPIASFEEGLAGRIAGVQVSSSDGQPGTGFNIVIRGASSLTQSNAPLFVIDGFPVEDPDNLTLNPADIETMNVLKDASSTAIYGSRAANGVVIIETKKGKLGEPKIDFSTFLGYQPLRKHVPVMDAYEFVKYQIEYAPVNEARYLSPEVTLESYKNVKGVNWQDEIFKDAFTTNNTLSINGGTKQTKYFATASVMSKDGIIPNSGLNRAQARLNLVQEFKKNLKVNLNINYTDLKSHGQLVSAGDGSLGTRSFLFWRIWGFRPVLGIAESVDDNGDIIDLTELERDPTSPGTSINPLIAVTNIDQRNRTSSLTLNGSLNYSFAKKFDLKIQGVKTINNIQNSSFYGSKAVDPASTRGVNGSIYNTLGQLWSNENTLSYKTTFSKKHNLVSLVGFSLQGASSQSSGYGAQKLPNEVLGLNGLDNGTPFTLRSNGNETSLMSYYTRFNYNYASKYLVTATFRSDGSSKFPVNNRWGYFPSAAIAWNMHREDYLNRLKWLSEAKLRSSYGLTGNNRVAAYGFYSTIDVVQSYAYSFDDSTPALGTGYSLGNQDLKWETTAQLDVGLDLALFKNRVQLTIDYYEKRTRDMLLDAQLPQSMGFVSAFKNVGKMKNSGWEFSLNTINISNKNFKWNTNFNISFNRNKILELTEGQTDLFEHARFETQFNMPLYISKVGESAGQFYGHVFDGLYQLSDFDYNATTQVYTLKADITANGAAATRPNIRPGDIKYKDLNGDKIIDANDRTVIGRGMPKHIGGFINNFQYKGFDLSVFFQWSYGNMIYNANRLILEGNHTSINHSNQFASYADRWSLDNQDSKNYRVGGQGPITHSSRVLEDGSYLRLKTLSFGYTFANTLTRKIGLDNLRLNVAMQNLITWTNYSGMDPEVSTRNSILSPGFDFSAYPQARTITLGLNTKF